jgi:hypothetical protein
MGQGIFATDINCYHKMRIGWIKDEDTQVINIPDADNMQAADVERIILVESLS